MENNELIKLEARKMHVPLWRLGDRLGVSEATVQRILRRPITKERYELYRGAIRDLAREEAQRRED